VLLIRTPKGRGTGFTIDVDGRQYLVTAKHLVSGLKKQDEVEVSKDENWNQVHVIIYRCDDPIDIAVLIPDKQLTLNFPLEPGIAGAMFGQDVYFAGFPHGESYMKGGALNLSHPFPFTKRATFSAQAPATDHPSAGAVIYLDGMNNFGFSGAPIVFRDLHKNEFVYKVAGVVSGFQPELLAVMSPQSVKPNEDLSNVEPWRIVKRADGTKVRYKDTEQRVASNMGIVIGYEIASAIELIKNHPDGPKTTDAPPQP